MRAPTIHQLICGDLGYCCEWMFFHYHRDTRLIAERLGVSPRQIRIHKAAAALACCDGREECLKRKLREARSAARDAAARRHG